jgi:hypothetical protein
VPGTRLCIATLAISVTLVPAVGLGDGTGASQHRLDPSRINQLIQIIQTDVDEKRRETAIEELSKADPRLNQGVIQVLADALRKDTSPAVRLAAVRAIGRHKTVFVLAGRALEFAVETDSSPAIQKAAKQVLWEYHLLGYKSAPTTDDFTWQTVEPPIAKPARIPVPVTAEPPVVAIAVHVPSPVVTHLPPAGPAPGPRIPPLVTPIPPGAKLSAVPPHPNVTGEPPLAVSKGNTAPPPALSEPPILPKIPEPLIVGIPHPYAADLPPIVPPPGEIPGVIPFPDTTIEPPILKKFRR